MPKLQKFKSKPKPKPKPKAHSNEYLMYIRSAEWYRKSGICLALTGKRCVVFPWLRARDSHHMTYRNLKKEMLIRDIVPVSKIGHWLLHRHLFWKISTIRMIINWYLRIVTVVVVIPLGTIARIK